jgi:hypothetical protein
MTEGDLPTAEEVVEAAKKAVWGAQTALRIYRFVVSWFRRSPPKGKPDDVPSEESTYGEDVESSGPEADSRDRESESSSSTDEQGGPVNSNTVY